MWRPSPWRLRRVQRFLIKAEMPSTLPNITQVCTADIDGNAVSLTHSVAACSGVVVPGLGFLFNGQMHRFNPVPGYPNSIAPGKRRTTGMSPSVIFRDGKLFMVLGAPGGMESFMA